jgi:enamine deaminase RidA (YjgF/YER057c/UK114 family)
MSIGTFNTPEFAPIGDQMGFSQAVAAGGLLFVSGAIGMEMSEAGPAVPSDMETEFRTAFKSLEEVLTLAGVTFADVVEMTTYHVEDAAYPNQGEIFLKVRNEFMSAPWPAWTGVGISALTVPGAHVEISLTAKMK